MSLRWQGEFLSKSKCYHQECVRAVENKCLFKEGLHFPTPKCVRFFKVIAILSLSGEDKCVVWLQAEVEGNWSNGFWMIFEQCL